MAEGSVPPGYVARVYQKGYRLRDRLLRPARVVVAMGAKAKPSGEEPVN
jgi:molecular chaperone GrpE (heat shock protein)